MINLISVLLASDYFEVDESVTKIIGKGRNSGLGATFSALVELSFVILGIAGIIAVILAYKHFVKGDRGDSDAALLKVVIGLVICAVMIMAIQAAFMH